MPALKTRAVTTPKVPRKKTHSTSGNDGKITTHGRASARMPRAGVIDRGVGRFMRFAGPFTMITLLLQQFSMLALPFAGFAKWRDGKLGGKTAERIANAIMWPQNKLGGIKVGDLGNKAGASRAAKIAATAKDKLPGSVTERVSSLRAPGFFDKIASWRAGRMGKKAAAALTAVTEQMDAIAAVDNLPGKAKNIIGQMKSSLDGGAVDLGNLSEKGKKLIQTLQDAEHEATPGVAGVLEEIIDTAAFAADAGKRSQNTTFSSARKALIERVKGQSLLETFGKVASAAYTVQSGYNVLSGTRGALHNLRMVYADLNNVDVSNLSWFGSFKLTFKAIFRPGKSAVMRHARKHFFLSAMPKVFVDFLPALVLNFSGRFMKNASQGKRMMAAMVTNGMTGRIINTIESRRDVLSAYQMLAYRQASGEAPSQQEYAVFIDSAIPKGQARPENAIDWAAAYYARNNTDIAEVLNDIETGKIRDVAKVAYNESLSEQESDGIMSQGQNDKIYGKHTDREMARRGGRDASDVVDSILNGEYSAGTGAVTRV